MHTSIAEDSIPPFFEVNYKLYSNDTKIGQMERRFYKKEPNNYIFSSESRTTGLISLFRKDQIIEISNWNYSDSTIIPMHYSYKHTGGKKNRDVEINFNHLFELCEHAYLSARKSISLQRYKGLGEMNPSQLAETTMNPETRSLLQVSQIDDDDYAIFDTLMGDDVEKRRDFIVSSANAVENVDV